MSNHCPDSSRRRFLGLAAALPFAGILSARMAFAQHFSAKLCNNCGFGSKKDNCAKCGKWMGNTKMPARLCGDHGFGSKGDNCVVCGKWVGSAKIPAMIGNCCGFGSKKDNCVICGKWAP